MGHDGVDDRHSGLGQMLIVAGEPPRVRGASESALDHPAARDDLEALRALLQAEAPRLPPAMVRKLDAPTARLGQPASRRPDDRLAESQDGRNFVTVARLERNSTIREEIQARGFGRHIPAGFLCHAAAQAADFITFKATLMPVGEDQAPLIEQTNVLVRRLNRQVDHALLPKATALMKARSWPKRRRVRRLPAHSRS